MAPTVLQHPGAWPRPQGGPDMQQTTPSPLGALDGKATITIEQTAKLLGLGRTAAYDAAGRGELPTRRLGPAARPRPSTP